jgi:microcompartment protein CcmK/EutM
MIRGTVVGEVWAARKSRALVGSKLLLVAVEGTQRLVVSRDILDAGAGDRVLVSWGSGARNVLQPGPDNRHLLCDAAISLVVDGCSDPRTEGETKGGP